MLVAAGAKLDVKNKRGLTPWRIAEGAVFEDAVLAQPQTAALLRRLMEERGPESRIGLTTRPGQAPPTRRDRSVGRETGTLRPRPHRFAPSPPAGS